MVWVYLDLVNNGGAIKPLMAAHGPLHAINSLLQLLFVRVLLRLRHQLHLLDILHYLLPLYLIVDSQIYLDQVLIHVEHRIILIASALHEEICIQFLEVVLVAVRRPGVPLGEPILLKDHLGAEFPTHVNLVASAEELLLE